MRQTVSLIERLRLTTRLALRSSIPALVLAASLQPAPAGAQDGAAQIRVGIAAPLSGASAVLGAQISAGAKAVGTGAYLVEADTACTGEGGAEAARRLVAAKVAIVAGFLCTESLEAALPVLTGAGIPVIDVGVRANRFTDKRSKTKALIWRIAPRSDAEADAVAARLAARWRDVPFGLVDDGTIYGRGLVDAVRTRLEAVGLRAATIDTYRPAEEKQFGLVRRILATGVTHLLVAGDRPDVAIIARDAASLDLGLEIVGGETLLDEADPAVPLPKGIVAVAPLERFPGLEGLAGKHSSQAPEGYFGPAAVATRIAIDAVTAARASGSTVTEVLDSTGFQTVLGPVRFDAEGDGDLNLYRTFRFDGTGFVPETGG